MVTEEQAEAAVALRSSCRRTAKLKQIAVSPRGIKNGKEAEAMRTRRSGRERKAAVSQRE